VARPQGQQPGARAGQPALDQRQLGNGVDGPWALFRVLDDGQLEAGDAPEKFFITFQIGARKTRFEVTTNSVQHPIRLRELREFACPEGL
jgi:type VI secretion system protein ImpL